MGNVIPLFGLLPLKMSAPEKTPLDRARAKLSQIERELKKSPDFQLYLVAKSHSDRARMKRLLMEIPNFRLWRILANAVKRPRRRAHGTFQNQTGASYETTPV
jgi:hypothetical protein